MTKLEKFVADEAKRDTLEKALPVVIEALEALKDQLEAGHVNEGVPNPDVGNSYYQQVVGARHLIINLPFLTRPLSKKQMPEPRRQYTEADRGELKNLQKK